MKRVAVYSGTFNPLHIGHLAIMRYLTERMGFDEVYLVVSPQSPFKCHLDAESGKERFRAAQAAVERHPELKVRPDDTELHLPAPNYTIRTLDALKRREPDNGFTLIIGADNLEEIARWRDYRRLLTEYGVAVYPRQDHDMDAAKKRLEGETGGDGYRITLMSDAPVVDVSSTMIREGLAAGKDMSRFLM